MKSRWSLWILAAFLGATVVRADSSTVPLDGRDVVLAHYAKAYIGAGNIKVELAPYTVGLSKGALIAFHGIEGDWDGKILNHTYKDEGYGSASYTTTYNDKPWHSIRVREGDDGKQLTLFVPGTRDEVNLVASDGAAQLTSPKAMYDAYLAQGKK